MSSIIFKAIFAITLSVENLYTPNFKEKKNSILSKRILISTLNFYYMEVIIKSANFKASKQLEKLIIEKVNKLFHHSNNIIQALVVLREEEKKSHENKSCEIKLVVPGYDHFAKKKTDSYEKSITQAVDTLQNVILKTKKRAIAKRHSHNPIS